MIACIRLPYYAIELARRAPGAPPAGTPLALVDHDAQTVRAASTEAVAAGIIPGMMLRAAQALCPDLHARPYDWLAVRRGMDTLLTELSAFSDYVEAEGGITLRGDRRRKSGHYLPGAQVDRQSAATVYVDLGKLKWEASIELAHHLHEAARTATGIDPALGLAQARFTALLAARSVAAGEMTLVQPRGQADFLAPFPAAALPLDREQLRQLDLLGLRTLGQIAALGSAVLSDRFGPTGTRMAQLATGKDRAGVARYVPRRSATRTEEIGGWRQDQATLLALLTRMAGDGGAALAAHGCAADSIELRVTLDGGRVLGDSLALREPVSGASRLAETAFDLLERLPVRGEIASIELRLSGSAPVHERQLSLFDRPPVPAEQLRAALAGLTERHGDCFYVIRPAAAGAARPEDRYRLDRAGDDA